MSTDNGNSPAMPSSVSGTADGGILTSHDFEGEEGLSKREHFAGLAMQGILASPDEEIPERNVARSAVSHADALLSELAKP